MGQATTRQWERVWLPWLAFVAILALALYPLSRSTIPPLYDYLNWLAGLHVLNNHDLDSDLGRHYDVAWSAQPNLAFQILTRPLASHLTVYETGRILVALALALPLLGTWLLHRVLHGRFTYWPLAAAPVLYNHPLALGFLNYVISTGLALLGMALWFAIRERPPLLRLVVGTAIATALYFGHLVAFAAYGLVVMLEAIASAVDIPRRREAAVTVAIAAGTFAVPVVFYLAVETAFPSSYTQFGGLREKLFALVTPVDFLGNLWDRLIFLVLVAVFIAGLVKGWLVIARPLRPALLVLVVTAFALPHLLHGVMAADWRLPSLIVFLIIASSRLELPSPGLRYVVGAAFIALLAARTVAIDASWRAHEPQYQEFRRAVQSLPRGARVLTAENAFETTKPARNLRYAFVHIDGLAVIDRSVFTPSTFTFTGPVFASAANARINSPASEPLHPRDLAIGVAAGERGKLGQPVDRRVFPLRRGRFYWADWPNQFDYVIWLHYGDGAKGVPETYLKPVVRGSFFDLFQVVPG